MSTHTEKREVTKGRNAAAITPQISSRPVAGQSSSTSTAITQRKLREAIRSSAPAQRAALFQQTIKSSLQAKKMLASSQLASLAAAQAPASKIYTGGKTIQAKAYASPARGVIQLKPPKDKHILTYTDDMDLIWSRDSQTAEWCRLGDNDEKVFWTVKDDIRQETFLEAGSVVNYFKNPRSIWGKTHQNLEAELTAEGFRKSDYRGTSEAHEYKKVLSDNSVISVVINYGGGRHTHTLGKAKFDPAFYYKLEWNKYFKKMKVIDPTTYPREERAQEKFEFVEK